MTPPGIKLLPYLLIFLIGLHDRTGHLWANKVSSCAYKNGVSDNVHLEGKEKVYMIKATRSREAGS